MDAQNKEANAKPQEYLINNTFGPVDKTISLAEWLKNDLSSTNMATLVLIPYFYIILLSFIIDYH